MSGGIPFIHAPELHLGIPIQPFGVIVAAGVLIGAEVMRRYSLRHGVDDDDLRGLTGWVVITGFLGAHIFDTLVYEPQKLSDDGFIALLKFWDGISSWGGFIGGAMGYAFYVWWKRLTPGLIADTTAVGLLLGFSIGRIGCTIVHDHVGSPTSFFLGVDYPSSFLHSAYAQEHWPAGNIVRAHNLAMYELMYLIPVNILVLYLAFQRKRRLPAGFVTILTAFLYAPVRFFLEFYRLNSSDPRYAGLTFAQWASIAAFVIAGYVGWVILQRGQPAPLASELDGKPGGRKSTLQALAVEREKKAKDAEKPDKAEKSDKPAKSKGKKKKAD